MRLLPCAVGAAPAPLVVSERDPVSPTSVLATVPACVLEARRYFLRAAIECAPADTGCAGADRRGMVTPFRLTAALLPTDLPTDASAREFTMGQMIPYAPASSAFMMMPGSFHGTRTISVFPDARIACIIGSAEL